MPLYEYECGACRHRFERIQRFSDPPLTDCPACGGPIHKLLSSPAIQFKGSGFYITDYARAGKPADTSEGGAADGKKPAEGTGKPAPSAAPGQSASDSSGGSGGSARGTEGASTPAKPAGPSGKAAGPGRSD